MSGLPNGAPRECGGSALRLQLGFDLLQKDLKPIRLGLCAREFKHPAQAASKLDAHRGRSEEFRLRLFESAAARRRDLIEKTFLIQHLVHDHYFLTTLTLTFD